MAISGALVALIVWWAGASPAQAESLQFPLDLQHCLATTNAGIKVPCYISQDYGDYGSNTDKPNSYHTGIDVRADPGTEIRSMVKGTVVLIQEYNEKFDEKNTLPCQYRPPDGSNCADRGYGNTVIVKQEGRDVYVQYSHLNEIKKVEENDLVEVGTVLGTVGASGYDSLAHYDAPHLHFEVKQFETLVFDENTGPFAYSTKHPNKYDYLDPITEYDIRPQGSREIIPFPVRVRVTLRGERASIRWLPGLKHVRKAIANEEFEAVRFLPTNDLAKKIDDENKKCSRGWYQVRLSEENKNSFTYQRELENGNKVDVILEKAWICRGNEVGDKVEIWVEEMPETVTEQPTTTTGLATALVLDVSGSMGWKARMDGDKTKIDLASGAVKLFRNTASATEQCSLSTFAGQGDTVSAMSPCQSAAIPPLSAGGGTNIGGGLDKAFDQLCAAGGDEGQKAAVLLSDGAGNIFDPHWRDVVPKFADPAKRAGTPCERTLKRWPIYTVGFYTDPQVLEELKRTGRYAKMAEQEQKEKTKSTLREIAYATGGAFQVDGNHENLKALYIFLRATVNGESVVLNQADYLPRDGRIAYSFPVDPNSERLSAGGTHFNTRLALTLRTPRGVALNGATLNGSRGRSISGDGYEILEVNGPMPGRWHVELRWADPPPEGERVNVMVSVKSDVLTSIIAFRGSYRSKQAVPINVQAVEILDDGERVPLLDARVRVQVQKPGGPKMAQMIRTRPINLPVAKRAVQGATRNVRLYDDGAHDDYRAADGIFGGSFTETDENGAYLVTATVTGHKRNGQRVQRKLIASFQVGPIAQNPVTTAQVLEVRDLLGSRTDPAEAIEALQSDPLAAIKGSQSDPLDAINKLRQGVQ